MIQAIKYHAPAEGKVGYFEAKWTDASITHEKTMDSFHPYLRKNNVLVMAICHEDEWFAVNKQNRKRKRKQPARNIPRKIKYWSIAADGEHKGKHLFTTW